DDAGLAPRARGGGARTRAKGLKPFVVPGLAQARAHGTMPPRSTRRRAVCRSAGCRRAAVTRARLARPQRAGSPHMDASSRMPASLLVAGGAASLNAVHGVDRPASEPMAPVDRGGAHARGAPLSRRRGPLLAPTAGLAHAPLRPSRDAWLPIAVVCLIVLRLSRLTFSRSHGRIVGQCSST